MGWVFYKTHIFNPFAYYIDYLLIPILRKKKKDIGKTAGGVSIKTIDKHRIWVSALLMAFVLILAISSLQYISEARNLFLLVTILLMGMELGLYLNKGERLANASEQEENIFGRSALFSAWALGFGG